MTKKIRWASFYILIEHCWTYPHHLQRFCTIFFFSGVTIFLDELISDEPRQWKGLNRRHFLKKFVGRFQRIFFQIHLKRIFGKFPESSLKSQATLQMRLFLRKVANNVTPPFTISSFNEAIVEKSDKRARFAGFVRILKKSAPF